MTSINNAISDLKIHMLSNGFPFPEIKYGGHPNRFSRSPEQKKKNCWAIARQFQLKNGSWGIWCQYGDWKTGETYVCVTHSPFHISEKKEVRNILNQFKGDSSCL